MMRSLWLLFLLTAVYFCSGQPCKCNARIISSAEAYNEVVKADPGIKLIVLRNMIPGLVVDMPYATTHNFTKTVLYHHAVAYLCERPANGLKKVQEALNKKGLALKIYDAYRPFNVTCRIWKLVQDKRYAANPRDGSNHNRGVAVDLTVIDIKTGKELDMGTSFDNFTDTAHHDFRQLPAQVLANRKLLKATMRAYGFDIVPEEWWHYQWKNRAGYEVMDLDFDELKKIVNE
jgi:zinc D-Ala-D-Ala dipeptidase